MSRRVAIAVAGAGMMGKRHAEAIAASREAMLHAIVDPADAARDHARMLGIDWYPSLGALFERGKPDGIILATPNQLHVEGGLECVAAGVPAIVEKPLAADLEGARTLVAASEGAGVPLLVGHHRRHNPLIAAASQQIGDGRLGAIIAVHGMFWAMKPDDYFESGWRREAGAGPVLLNLVHDIDLLRHLVGEIVSVHAMESSATRGHGVEDSAAILLRFENSALGTVTVSDTIVAPWSWELTSAENPAYPPTGQSCYFIGGTHGSMELPNLKIWSNPDARSWWEPITAASCEVSAEDPLVRQIDQFARVIRGLEAPLVPAREGLKTLEVIDAVKRSAATSQAATIGAAGE